MRVSKDQAEANRKKLISTAGRLFRARGLDGVGVAEVAKEAGLTHGALYAHFSSKEALAAEALEVGMKHGLEQLIATAGGKQATFCSLIDALLSLDARDGMEEGCPATASASEISRRDVEVSARFTEGIERLVSTLEATTDKRLPADVRRNVAITAVAAELGAIVIARGVRKYDTALSEEMLVAVRAQLPRLNDID